MRRSLLALTALFVAPGLVVAASLAGSAPTASAQSPMPAAPSPVRLVSQTATVRFGRGIDLTARLQNSAAEITSIKSYFQPQGTRTITTYGYPGFTPGRDVTTNLTIQTSSPFYYPPGVVFEVRYEVTDASGNRYETEPATVEYLDPAFDWKRRTKDNLTVIYHDRPQATIDGLLEAVGARAPSIESTIGAGGGGGPYRAVLFNSNAEARRAFPFVSQAASDGHVFGGFAYEQYGLLVLDHAGVAGVTHELTHLIFGSATNAPTAKRPAWLNEGLAVYFETGSRATSLTQLQRAIRGDSLLSLRAMNSIPGRPEQIDVFYPQSGNFVGYLIERHGGGPMRALVASMRRGVLPAEAVPAAYGITLEGLEAAWRLDVGARAIEPAVPGGATAAEPSADATATGDGPVSPPAGDATIDAAAAPTEAGNASPTAAPAPARAPVALAVPVVATLVLIAAGVFGYVALRRRRVAVR
jgi:hypothetical protein